MTHMRSIFSHDIKMSLNDNIRSLLSRYDANFGFGTRRSSPPPLWGNIFWVPVPLWELRFAGVSLDLLHGAFFILFFQHKALTYIIHKSTLMKFHAVTLSAVIFCFCLD